MVQDFRRMWAETGAEEEANLVSESASARKVSPYITLLFQIMQVDITTGAAFAGSQWFRPLTTVLGQCTRPLGMLDPGVPRRNRRLPPGVLRRDPGHARGRAQHLQGVWKGPGSEERAMIVSWSLGGLQVVLFMDEYFAIV